jgi:hypothetical protein
MKSASASSGVGVQVEIHPARDMSPAVRTVYELSCRVADADRSDEQRPRSGRPSGHSFLQPTVTR